jgi:putative membrane protein
MFFLTDAVVQARSDHWDGPGPWWPLFPLLWLFIIAGVVTLFVISGRRNRHRAGARAGESRLAERFAAGEIAEEEYRSRLDVLKEKR